MKAAAPSPSLTLPGSRARSLFRHRSHRRLASARIVRTPSGGRVDLEPAEDRPPPGHMRARAECGRALCDFVLANTTDVRILATSRQVLRAEHEKLVWLAPLEIPPPEHADTAEDILKYSAPQLLAVRASEKAGYRVEDNDARAITEICRQLDGAPLAIELVSSRLKGRNAETVLKELDDRFRSLRKREPRRSAAATDPAGDAGMELRPPQRGRSDSPSARSPSLPARSIQTRSPMSLRMKARLLSARSTPLLRCAPNR